MFERFTDRSRRVLVLAQEEARLLNHNFIGTEHILLGLIHEGDGIAAKALESLGVSLEKVRDKVEETIGPVGTSTTGSPPFTPRAKKVLELSLREAQQLGHDNIGTEHILLGLVREGAQHESVAAQILVSLGADPSRVRQQVVQLLSGVPAGEGGVAESVSAGAAGSVPSRRSGPRCPGCRAPLEGQVAYRVLTVAPAEPDLGVGPLQVAFVYCRRCGVTIAHTPTGPDNSAAGSPTTDPATTTAGTPEPPRWVARSQLIRSRTPPETTSGGAVEGGERPIGSFGRPFQPPRAPTRVFPDDLWSATPPSAVPAATVVDVRHSGRFREDGNIRGAVAGLTIELALELPRSASSATGTLGDAPVNMTWSLSNNSTGEPELPATLRGSVGAQTVSLEGVFRLGPGFWFDGASVQGTLADADLTASIKPATGAYGSSDTVVATGTYGDHHFEVFAAVDGSLKRGLVRGTYDGQTVHLDLNVTRGADAHVAGTCPAPPSFTLLLIASILFFV